MTGERVVRRLAAILAADVAGYSRLMGRDEHGTLTRLKAHRTERLEPTLARHGGRLVKLTGDGALVEFPSAVDALGAAIEFQQAMAEANQDQPEDTAVVFRVGLHLGDLIVDGDDLYGDGVNVAARLEAEAPPGGIVVSRAIREAVQGRLNANLHTLGDLTLKNIERPIRAFRVEWTAEDWPAPSTISPPASPTPTSSNQAAPALALRDKPSVAVLPFQAVGGDAELESFVDGLTEDVITGLSLIKAMWVIARNTMFTYKGRAIDVRTVGMDLGVRYVLEGSVRKAEGRLRMTTQLVEAETGHDIWVAKIDRAGGGLFELQDHFAQYVVASIQTQLALSEGKTGRKEKAPSGVADLLARAWKRHYDLSAEGLSDTVSLAEKALALDPSNGEACRMIATGVWHQAYRGFIPWDRVAADRVMLFAQRAVVAEEADEYAHWILGLAYLMARQHDRAIISLRRALDINPSCSLAYGSMGTVLAWGGEPDESVANNELALRINPSDPTIYHRHFGLALAHYLASRYAKALEHALLVLQHRSDWWLALIIHAATLAQVGQIAEAQAVCADLRRVRPDMTVTSLNVLPFAKVSDRDHVADGLRKAGLPEK